MPTVPPIGPELDHIGQSKQRDSPSHDHEYGTDQAIQFRSFRVLPRQRRLFRDGVPIELGGRTFDLLMVLLRSRGSVVTKNDIFRYVWPALKVEDTNLRFQMAALRKALGADRDVIKTIPGRGYLLAGEGGFGRGAQISGQGTVSLPPIDSPLASMPTTELRAEARDHTESPVVLIIDDDRDTREALEGLLRAHNLRVASFPTVPAFLESSRPSPLGCIVLDVWLPGFSGLEFQAQLAGLGIRVPVIFISGYADVHTSVRAMKAGAVEFLTKPVQPDELLQAIESAIGSVR